MNQYANLRHYSSVDTKQHRTTSTFSSNTDSSLTISIATDVNYIILSHIASYLSNSTVHFYSKKKQLQNKRVKFIFCSFRSILFWNIQIMIHFFLSSTPTNTINMMMTFTVTTLQYFRQRMPTSHIELRNVHFIMWNHAHIGQRR